MVVAAAFGGRGPAVTAAVAGGVDTALVALVGEREPLGSEIFVVNRIIAAEINRYPLARFDVDAPAGLPPAAGDATFVEQVVRNLVGNAIKYAGPRAKVGVSAREAGPEIEVEVADDGPGIPESEREAIFDIFFRSRSTAVRAGGAGVGLFVCRRLVEAMGGRIWASESAAGGASFTFTVPSYAVGLLGDPRPEPPAGSVER